MLFMWERRELVHTAILGPQKLGREAMAFLKSREKVCFWHKVTSLPTLRKSGAFPIEKRR